MGVVCSFRASAAVEVVSKGSCFGLWVNRLGRGSCIDLMLRRDVYEDAGSDERAAEQGPGVAGNGRRKDGGKELQLRTVLGGISCDEVTIL